MPPRSAPAVLTSLAPAKGGWPLSRLPDTRRAAGYKLHAGLAFFAMVALLVAACEYLPRRIANPFEAWALASVVPAVPAPAGRGWLPAFGEARGAFPPAHHRRRWQGASTTLGYSQAPPQGHPAPPSGFPSVVSSAGCLAAFGGCAVVVAYVVGAATHRIGVHRKFQPVAMMAVSGMEVTDGPTTTLSSRPWTTRDWYWRPAGASRDFRINYATAGSGSKAIVLVHGFGADVNNWRAVIPFASSRYTVYAIDLLGYGSSEKPVDHPMSIDCWAQQLTDFCRAFIPPDQEFVVVGNSIGSLVALTAAADPMRRPPEPGFLNLRGLLLLNCAVGMNNKTRADELSKLQTWDEYLLAFLSPLLGVLERLLRYRPTARWLFQRVASADNVRGTLRAIYTTPARVDDELVADILRPAQDDGALDVFVSTLTGDPGRRPKELVPSLRPGLRVAVLWGRQDRFTPISGPVARLFQTLAAAEPTRFRFEAVDGGHVLHDDVPTVTHRWLEEGLGWTLHE